MTKHQTEKNVPTRIVRNVEMSPSDSVNRKRRKFAKKCRKLLVRPYRRHHVQLSQLNHVVMFHGKPARLVQSVFAKKPRRKNANKFAGKCSGVEFVVIMVTETDCIKCLPRNT